MTAPDLLDCGHPDTDPDVAHTAHRQGCSRNGCDCPPVCRDCCPTCKPPEKAG